MRDREYYQQVIDRRKRLRGSDVSGLILMDAEKFGLTDLLRVHGELLKTLAQQYQAMQYEALRSCDKDRLDGVRGKIDALDEFLAMLAAAVEPKEMGDAG